MLNRLSQTLAIASLLSVPILPAGAEAETASTQARPLETSPAIAEQPATTVAEWMAQVESALVQITAVRLEPTEAGLQVVLETAEGELATPTTEIVGNALIADIPNAVLALPEGGSFEQFEPAAGIALVSVTNEPGDQVRVSITGTDAPPVAEVTATGLAVTLGEAVAGAEDDAIQVVVTGEDDEGYSPSNSSTATGTDTPLSDIPLSIQVIPEQVLEDRNVVELGDALETAGGVVEDGNRSTGLFGPGFLIRGFEADVFRDGIQAFTFAPLSTNNIERVEVLKGPASVLYGQGSPGGIINLVTKQPLSEPFYEASATVGSFSTYRGALDLSGPLNEDRSVRYRLNLSYENFGSFRDVVNGESFQISPVMAWDIGPNTSLDLYGQYTYDRETTDQGIPFTSEGEPVDVPRSRFLGDEIDEFTQDQFSIGYRLNHNFSDNWSISHNAEYLEYNAIRDSLLFAFTSFDDTTGELMRDEEFADDAFDRFFANAEVQGRFNTGPVQHQLLVGLEYRSENSGQDFQFGPGPSINVFDPVYTNQRSGDDPFFFREANIQTVSAYVQDQIDLTPELKLLLGVRFDSVDQFRTAQNEDDPREEFELVDEAFTPRVGLVYQPIQPLSLYASYSTSFEPSFATLVNADGSFFEPEEGRQFEVGAKADISDQLSLTLAAFDIRRQNVNTPDPEDPLFSIQTGEVTSRGIELNLNGEILPGWNITAAYTYLDAFVSEDTTDIVGNRPADTPENQFSLWTTYEIQAGEYEGLGAGLGFFYVGDRQGDLENTFTLPSYFRTDAALFYGRDNWRAQLNFENLFNIEYFTSANYESLTSVNVGAPFSVNASFSIEF
ncbi:MAG: TonB-dependent siderophore receptor [Cyanobacteria bacterium J06626_4]